VPVALLSAYIRAYDYLNEHPDEAAELTASALYPQELTQAMLDDIPNYRQTQSGAVTEAAIARLQRLPDFLASHGYIEKSYDVSTIVDGSYYEKAYARVHGN